MSIMNNKAISQKIKAFADSLRINQREKFKAKKRNEIIEFHVRESQEDMIYQFKKTLFTIDFHIKQQETRVLNFLRILIQSTHDQSFCEIVLKSYVLEELLQHTSKKLKEDEKLDASQVVQQLFQLLYRLLAQKQTSLGIIDRHFSLLIYLQYRYPYHFDNLEKFYSFIACILDKFIAQNSQICEKQIIYVCQEDLIRKLMRIYICETGYISVRGIQESKIIKRSKKWFKNAIKCFEVIYGLILIRSSYKQGQFQEQILEDSIVREALYDGLIIFLQEERFTKNNDLQFTQSDSMGETVIAFQQFSLNSAEEQKQTNFYFLSIIIDIMLMRITITSREDKILNQILELIIREVDNQDHVRTTVVKIIKLLYQQLALTEQTLIEFAENYHSLTPLIENIIYNDHI